MISEAQLEFDRIRQALERHYGIRITVFGTGFTSRCPNHDRAESASLFVQIRNDQLVISCAQKCTPAQIQDAFGTGRDTSTNGDPGSEEKSRSTKESAGPSASTSLVKLALDRYEFGCTGDGQPFAVRPGGHVVRMLRGGKNSLRVELSSVYFRLHGKAAPQQALADALLVLEGQAMNNDPRQVHLRVASAAGAVWLDLGDAAETVIRIDANDWNAVTSDVPVLFQRTALTGVMPMPQRGGDLDLLWRHINVAAVDRPLVVAWGIAAIATPDVPHAVLSLFGNRALRSQQPPSGSCRRSIRHPRRSASRPETLSHG